MAARLSGLTWRYGVGLVIVLIGAVGLSFLAPAAGLLPFVFGVVGVFFFMLAGLVMGAILYRCGRPGRPMSAGVLVGSAVGVAVVMAGLSMVQEHVAFKDKAVEYVLKRNQVRVDARVALRSDVAGQIDGVWRERYGVGGIVGYVVWTARGAPTFGVAPPDGVAGAVRHAQGGWSWGIRALLSFVGLGWAIGAQLMPLTREEKVAGGDA